MAGGLVHCLYREGEYGPCPTQELTGKRSLYLMWIFSFSCQSRGNWENNSYSLNQGGFIGLFPKWFNQRCPVPKGVLTVQSSLKVTGACRDLLSPASSLWGMFLGTVFLTRTANAAMWVVFPLGNLGASYPSLCPCCSILSLWTENAGQVGFDTCTAPKGTDGAKESGNLLTLLVEAKFKSRWECILWYLRLTATTDERLMLAM